jgi:Uri superfamily endonuclease
MSSRLLKCDSTMTLISGGLKKIVASGMQLGWPERGTYVLVLKLTRASVASVGSLGRIRFESGYYAYVGSARRGMRSRLSRHLATEKRKRWHIDWLTTHPNVVPIAVATTGRTGLECEIAGLLSARAGALVRGFGCSDCKCESHLCYFSTAHALNLALDDLRTLGLSRSTPRTYAAGREPG